jgi:hypothetical protein
MLPAGYNYCASIVVPSNGVHGPLWMVKRWIDDPNAYTEALISVKTDDPTAAIDAAIARGSWA